VPYILLYFKSLPPDQREWRVVVSGDLFKETFELEYSDGRDAMGEIRWRRWGRENCRGEESVPRSCFLGLVQLINRAGK
jgi:hypothetical protein